MNNVSHSKESFVFHINQYDIFQIVFLQTYWEYSDSWRNMLRWRGLRANFAAAFQKWEENLHEEEFTR